MTIYLDPTNKEVIKATSTKASQKLWSSAESLSLAKVVSAHSSQQLDVDFSKLGYNEPMTATQYCKKYNVSV